VTSTTDSGGAVWLTAVAPVEVTGARGSGRSGGQNSLALLPMQLERCRELTWAVLELRGSTESADGSKVDSSSFGGNDRGLRRSVGDVN
jgi:hypothetical protein